ncbi:MAG: MogA/MoaB family molybdenum cofactor biosynthesis protein [Methanolinea sp.]|jgi:molybdenum cofactor biosynthesis protein B|nr:MogA/MoaB family molybdenum cofactor biosynthesis protein [Methanolinea sp.]
MKKEHEKSVDISAAIITVSTSRTRDTDESGKAILSLLEGANIPVLHYSLVKDDIMMIRRELHAVLDGCNCIILNGGTGISPDDCTIEAVVPLLDKVIDGFGEIFRQKSYADIGTAAILSRAVAGTCGERIVFCLPGSTPAVTLAMKEIILPELRHIVSHARKRDH